MMREAGLRPALMIDCSHGNSTKDAARQPFVARMVAEQVAAGSRDIVGAMLESHLVGGRQDLLAGRLLTYGQSITDACLAWSDTVPLIRTFAHAVRARRRRSTAR